MVLGASILVMSLITDYELSLTRLIPMGAHLAVDGLGGALLAVSPWLFGFADRTYWPHLIIGIAEIGVSLVTRTRPDTTSATTGGQY
jgi:FtsH-binding integral membrane protein